MVRIRIGVIGMGVVGSALSLALSLTFPGNVNTFDKYKNKDKKYDPEWGEKEEYYIKWIKDIIRKSDVVFICVPTPTVNGKQDLSELDEVMEWLHPRQNNQQVICIKSTVLPGTTDTYRKKYGYHICYMPEFLDEKTAVADIIKPRRPPIIGTLYDANNHDMIINKIFNKIWKDFDVPRVYILYNKDAELIKYFTNCFYSLKCMFAHQIQEIMENEQQGYDVGNLMKVFIDNQRIGKHFWRVVPHKEFPLGGKCLPKDLEAFETWINHNLTDTSVLPEPNIFHLLRTMNDRYKKRYPK